MESTKLSAEDQEKLKILIAQVKERQKHLTMLMSHRPYRGNDHVDLEKQLVDFLDDLLLRSQAHSID